MKLTGRLLNFTRLNIEGNDIKVILTKIAQKLGRQRQSNLPVIVSCQQPLNLAQLWGGLWVLGLQPIGLVTGANDTQANELRIAIFPADGQRIDGKAAKMWRRVVSENQTAQPIRHPLNILRNSLPNHPHPTVKQPNDPPMLPLSTKPLMIW